MTSSSLDLSIIIINFNTKDLLKKCLDSVFKSLEKSELRFEIIVVDNGSEENLKSQISNLKSQYQNLRVKLIENKENLGFGKANNQGIKEAQGEYILLLNSDAEVIDQGIEKLLNFVKTNKKVDIAGGKLFNPDKSSQPSCGPFYSLPVCFLMLFLKGDQLGLSRWSPQKVKEVDWVSGACLMAKRAVFEKVSFDEKIFMYMEEIDFLYRAKKMGFRVYFYPQAHFFHLGAASSKGKETPILNIYQGLLYFYQKHHPGWPILILKLMLKAKARLASCWGGLTGNKYLKKTYEHALALVR